MSVVCIYEAKMMIRKQVYELTLDDLSELPAWEFALDEEGEENQDEATVRPLVGLGPIDPANGMQIIKAKFKLADGTTAQGYLTPPVVRDGDLGTIQPAIVTDKGQVSFWCGPVAPSSENLAESYRILSKNPLDVFPLSFESVVEVVDGPITGFVPGFMVLEDWRTGKTRTVI